jgi:hypothetical protein
MGRGGEEVTMVMNNRDEPKTKRSPHDSTGGHPNE